MHNSSYWMVPSAIFSYFLHKLINKKGLGLKRRDGRSGVSYSVNADALLKEVISKKDRISFTSITKSLLLKFVSTVLAECINRRRESKFNSQTPLHVILYESFLNKYGLRRTVEKKLKQVKSYIMR